MNGVAVAEVVLLVLIAHLGGGLTRPRRRDQPSPAANWTIDVSMSHSTGATSSV